MPTRLHRSNRLLRPDFTPFVAVGFILITFFVWLKQLERATILSVPLPFQAKWECTDPVKTGTILFLLPNNCLGVQTFAPATRTTEYYETRYSPATLRLVLLETQIYAEGIPVVLVKPTAQATFRNIVDVINGIRRNGQVRFWLVDTLTPDEQELIRAYTHYRFEHPTAPAWHRIKTRPCILFING